MAAAEAEAAKAERPAVPTESRGHRVPVAALRFCETLALRRGVFDAALTAYEPRVRERAVAGGWRPMGAIRR